MSRVLRGRNKLPRKLGSAMYTNETRNSPAKIYHHETDLNWQNVEINSRENKYDWTNHGQL